MKIVVTISSASLIYVAGCLFNLIECLRKGKRRRSGSRTPRHGLVNVFQDFTFNVYRRGGGEGGKLRKSIVIKQIFRVEAANLACERRQDKKIHFRCQFSSMRPTSCWAGACLLLRRSIWISLDSGAAHS